MTTSIRIALCLGVALATSACSTKPRNFSATVTPLAATSLAAQSESQVFSTCNGLVRSGHKGNFASAAATSVAGGAGAIGGGIAAFGASSTMAGAGAAVSVAVPVVGLVAAFGMNRMIRSGRERSYKRHMSTCMQELGYDVIDWTRVAKKQTATATMRPAPATEPAIIEPAPAEPAIVATAG